MASATMVTGNVRTMTQIIRDDPGARPDGLTVFAASLSRSVMTGRPLVDGVGSIMHRIQDRRCLIANDASLSSL
jgi:hypothetical protein